MTTLTPLRTGDEVDRLGVGGWTGISIVLKDGQTQWVSYDGRLGRSNVTTEIFAWSD